MTLKTSLHHYLRPLAAVSGCLLLVACATVERNTGKESSPPGSAEGIVQAEDGRTVAEFSASPETISADEGILLQVINRGEVPLSYGRPIKVERWDGAEWHETEESRDAAWTMELLFVAPGEKGVEQRWPFLPDHTPTPGWYRFTKEVQPETDRPAPERLTLQTRARVLE